MKADTFSKLVEIHEGTPGSLQAFQGDLFKHDAAALTNPENHGKAFLWVLGDAGTNLVWMEAGREVVERAFRSWRRNDMVMKAAIGTAGGVVVEVSLGELAEVLYDDKQFEGLTREFTEARA